MSQDSLEAFGTPKDKPKSTQQPKTTGKTLFRTSVGKFFLPLTGVQIPVNPLDSPKVSINAKPSLQISVDLSRRSYISIMSKLTSKI